MSFPIVFYNCTAEHNRVDKSDYLTEAYTATGVLRQGTSVINPVILVDLSDEDITQINFFVTNYAHISRFGRYYYITDIKSVKEKLVEVHMKVDVLYTYVDEIQSLTAIIKRQEKDWNLYLDDGVFSCYQNPNIVTKAFPSGFSSTSILLAVAGS